MAARPWLERSKAGAAVFAHVAARLVPVSGQLAGSLVLLFDVDEHTGGGGRDMSAVAAPVDARPSPTGFVKARRSAGSELIQD
jgi:hypothetical protein